MKQRKVTIVLMLLLVLLTITTLASASSLTYDTAENNITLGYDSLNRIVSKNSSTVNITYGYDRDFDGTLTNITAGNVTIEYEYDNKQRISKEIRTIDGIRFEKVYAYDSKDRLINTEVGTNDQDYLYNFQGKVQKVPSYVNNSAYNAFGSLLNRTYGNGFIQNFTYHSQTNRLTTISIPNVQNLSYTYDNVGNILTINDQINNRLHRLGYDDLNRMVSANISGERYVYSYNSLGNMMKIVKNNQTIKFTYNNLTHAPSEFLNGSAGADVYAPKEFNSTNKTRNFEFYIINDKNTTITNVNVTVRFGDGQTYTNNSLTIVESLRIVTSHNYTNAGSYVVNITVAAPNSSDSQIVNSQFGIRARNLTILNKNISSYIFEFKIHNDLLANAAGTTWNCSDGVSSLFTVNLTSNQTLFDYLNHNFTSAGDKTYACSAVSADGNDTAIVSFKVKGLEVQKYDTLYRNISNRIVSYDARNYFTQGITNISMDTGSEAFSQNASIATNERVWVFAQLNYTTDGIKDFSILLKGRNETQAYREEVSLKGAAIENYQRVESNTTKKILLFDIKNKWQEGNVSWNISEPALTRNNFIGNNKTIMVMIEQNYTGQENKEPTIKARVSTYVEEVKDFFEIKPVQIKDFSTLTEGTTAVSEMVVRNTVNSSQAFQWRLDSGQQNITSSSSILLNTSNIFIYIASNHTSERVFRTTALVNTSNSEDTAHGVIVS